MRKEKDEIMRIETQRQFNVAFDVTCQGSESQKDGSSLSFIKEGSRLLFSFNVDGEAFSPTIGKKAASKKSAIQLQSFIRGYLTRESMTVERHVRLITNYYLFETNIVLEAKRGMSTAPIHRYDMHKVAAKIDEETQIICKRVLCSSSSITRSGFQRKIKDFQKSIYINFWTGKGIRFTWMTRRM